MKKLTDRNTVRQFMRFVLVGLLNTAIGLGVTYILMGAFSVDYRLANAAGYGVGVLNSFFWNKLWVFGSRNSGAAREFIIFIIIFVICYGLQYWLLTLSVGRLGMNRYLAQLLAMGFYTVLSFVLNRTVTFASGRRPGRIIKV
ncbi:MAG: GtrA family protein [Alistipes sp.]|nr:GtrA family protein [Alistipes sp.]